MLQQTHADRGTAKNLFLRLLYGGSVQNWKKVHNIDTFATEPLAARFALEMRQIRKADCGANAEKMKKLKQVTPRPAEYLQYALNTAKERELIDKAIQVVEDAGGTVLALEHDGLFVHLPAEEFETFNRDMQCALGVNYPYTLQPTPSVEKALEKAKLVMRQGPLEHLWHLKDEEWRTHHHLICQAYTGNLAHHGLFAEVMLRSPAVNTNIPYSITQIFKILVDTGHKAWYSCQHLQWIITGDSAMDSLKSCIQIIAQRDLGHYHTTWTTESNEVRVSTRWDFSAEPFKNSVAQSLRPHLGATSELWALDGEETRRLLNFEGTVLDRETLQWRKVTPEMKISRSTGWTHRWPSWWTTHGPQIRAALRRVREAQDRPGDYELDRRARPFGC